MWQTRACAALLPCASLLAACWGGGEVQPRTPTPAAPVSPAAEVTTTPAFDGPVRKAYARGETVDIERGVLFLDPKTGGGEAWANVRTSPSGMYVWWNGPDGKQPPVLFETDTYREIHLDTRGQFGLVLDFSPDDSEVSVKTDEEMLILSTGSGAVRLRFSLPAGTQHARASWGVDGRVAVTTAAKDGTSLGLLAWSRGELKSFPGMPNNWAHWSPDGKTIAASSIREDGWLALIEFASGSVTRIERPLYNPRWSESGAFIEGQLLSGEVLVYRADGAPHMRLNGVCALLGTPWLGEEIATWGFGEYVRVAMDGTVRPYAPQRDGPASMFTDGGVALTDRPEGQAVAELQIAVGIAISWPSSPEGVHGVTADGRGMFLLGAGGKGWCENVGEFEVDLAPFEE